MGQYNPHAPYILGQEWVPIRNAAYVPDGVVERGYEFVIDAVTVPVSGAFYVDELPGNIVENACEFISVYPAGRESLSGPIKKLVIPASVVTVVNPGSIDVGDGVTSLLSSIDDLFVTFFAATAPASTLEVNFDTSPYAAILLGKRIVEFNLLYSMSSEDSSDGQNIQVSINNPASGSGIIYPQTLDVTDPSALNRVSKLPLGELTPLWDAGLSTAYETQRTVLPWRFQELNRFRSTASSTDELVVSLFNGLLNSTAGAFLHYLALEVTYCEETRVLYGGFRVTEFGAGDHMETYGLGAIATRMHNPVTHTQGATLGAGRYVVTVYHRDLQTNTNRQGAPRLHALREYYQLPAQIGRWVRQSNVEDAQFSIEDTNVLTQVTLHTATQIVTGSHPYGTQYGAPVYGSRTVIQEIEDNPANSAATYPQVRFYARRYGNTVEPLRLTDVATGTQTVAISVSDFDALEEIVDGWREVTLRFASPPTFPPTTDDVDWRWSATGELVGNQWQVMVADGPSGSWQPNPTAAATGPATYWAPLGSTVGLTWQSPTISGAAFDSTSDAVLIFSQDPPSVTGFGLEILEQELAVALRCETTPRCIPTALSYVSATWQYGSACVDELEITAAAVDTDNGTTYDLTPNQADVVIRGSFENESMPTGGNFEVKIFARLVDANNYVQARLFLTTGGTVSANINQLVGGVNTATGFPTIANLTSVTTPIEFEFSVIGTSLELRAWPAWQARPVTASLSMITTMLTPGDARISVRLDPSVTNTLPLTFRYLDTTIVPPALNGGSIEIQRYDAIDGEWRTVMLTSTPCPQTFDDYEARVGVESQYRIRTLNVLDFAGPWVTGSATIPAPGVDVSGTGNSVLIFTSNEQPDSNLAYVMQFEGQPVELFSFPEADTVSLQRIFGRDFFLAVRPLERGGDQFSRVILVNNAAIALPSLANFTGLRDLAWADINYVCVRDELGNRWFATVIVPEGTVRNDRTIYLARIDVAEVTDTPTALDS